MAKGRMLQNRISTGQDRKVLPRSIRTIMAYKGFKMRFSLFHTSFQPPVDQSLRWDSQSFYIPTVHDSCV
jgi:hypothetical protein